PGVAVAIRRRHQPRPRPDLAAVLELPPAEELVDQDPCPVAADALEPHQPSHLLHRRLPRLADLAHPAVVQVADLAGDQLPAVKLPEGPLPQPPWHHPSLQLPQPLPPPPPPRLAAGRPAQPPP